MSNKSNNKPEVIRSKNISLSIFSNTNKDDKEFKTYKLQRSFKRDDNSNWEHSDTRCPHRLMFFCHQSIVLTHHHSFMNKALHNLHGHKHIHICLTENRL